MPYIGKQLVRGQNRKLDDISSGFNGSQTTFTLQIASQNVSVGSALQLWISVGGVIQNPLTDFTIAGNQITFTTAPAASLDFFGVIQGDVTDTNTPGDATVTTSKLSTGLTVNLADGSAATSSLQLGGTDSGLFSSAADKVNVTTGGVERLEIGSSEVVFNDGSNDVDFRVESNGNTHMLFVDGGNDRIGIGTASPVRDLQLGDNTSASEIISLQTTTSGKGSIYFGDNTATSAEFAGMLRYDHADNSMQFRTSSVEALRIDSSGKVGIGTASPSSYNGAADNLVIYDSGNAGITIRSGTSSDGAIYFNDTDDANQRGIIRYVHASDALAFHTSAGESLRIDSSGNVGIGTSSPSTLMHLKDSADTYLTLQAGAADGNDGILFKNSAGTQKGVILFDTDNDYMLFSTNNTERMRLTSGGSLLLASRTSDDFAGAGTLFKDSSGGTSPVYLYFKKTFSGTRDAIDFRHSGTQVGSITFSNSNTAFNTSSDYRLKENIVDLTGAIARVNQLSPRRFNFIGESDTVDGFVAHEAQAVVPEAVHGTHNGVEVWDSDDDLPDGVSVGDSKLDENKNTIPKYQGIDQSKLVPLLTAALQEAIAEIETLKTKVAALEAG